MNDEYAKKPPLGAMPAWLGATMPSDWLKLNPPIRRQMTDEQRQAASERMKRLAQNQKEQRFHSEQDEQTCKMAQISF